ncbi:MAG: DUF2851 family protein [Bacteroidia bacterium]
MIQGVTEKVFHFIWQFRLYKEDDLRLTNGSKLNVITPGMYHQDSGPDFMHAKVRIDDTLWVGNVELHLKSSDWKKHNHHTDSSYDSVILHVVIHHDEEVFEKFGNAIPVLELRSKISPTLIDRWNIMNSGMFPIPCFEIGRVDVLTMNNWMDRLVVERLESRSEQIKVILKSCRFDWQETFHVFLFRAMGLGVNALPFELTARRVPYSLIYQYRHSIFQLEALLFGVSGLLPVDQENGYVHALLKEYEFLSRKHRLKPIEVHLWKFLRMRPMNFPTVRIAQSAAIHSGQLLNPDALCEMTSVDQILKVLKGQASEYWNNHYRFNEVSDYRKKLIGNESARGLIINAIIPVLFEYSRFRGNQNLRERCLDWLYQIKQEDNTIIRKWIEFGVKPTSAAQSQALVQLRKSYCDERRCLDCAVGHRLLKDTLKS